MNFQELEEIILNTAKKEAHNHDIPGLKESVSLNDILLHLPRKYWNKQRISNFENSHSLDMAQIVSNTIDKLIAEKKLQVVLHVTPSDGSRRENADGTKVEVPIGRYERTFAPV